MTKYIYNSPRGDLPRAPGDLSMEDAEAALSRIDDLAGADVVNDELFLLLQEVGPLAAWAMAHELRGLQIEVGEITARFLFAVANYIGEFSKVAVLSGPDSPADAADAQVTEIARVAVRAIATAIAERLDPEIIEQADTYQQELDEIARLPLT